MKGAMLLVILLFGYAYAQSGTPHPNRLETVANVDSGGVKGDVIVIDRRPNGRTKCLINFSGLSDIGGTEYGLFISQFPANFEVSNPCSEASIGGIYDPDGNLGTVNYEERCRADHTACAIGDLDTRHRNLTAADDGVLIELLDDNLPLRGYRAVLGHSIYLQRLDNGERVACGNLPIPSLTILQQVRFDGSPLSGTISIAIPQYDYIDNTAAEDSIILVDLTLTTPGPPQNSRGHRWQIQRGVADESCSRLNGILGQRPVNVGDPGSTCSRTEQRTCAIGDLSTKCGTLSVVNNRIRATCADSQLALVSFSTIRRLAISINQASGSQVILDCGQLGEIEPQGAFVDIFIRSSRVRVNLLFTQDSPFYPTLFRTYVVGLRGRASDIIVYDGDNPDLNTCTNLGNVLDRPGRPIISNPTTSDQYRIGDLGPKLGGVNGTDELRTQGTDLFIPLFGDFSIIGRPIALLRLDGSVWGCGVVRDYRNPPRINVSG